ncbi:hypothetical protein [Streptomyces sp. NBC_00154]|uniref:hypothetical protein n=1 Tax=Streptomyces sp. NBC_00154 TaxID=2975670 RepID=UPI00224FE2CA|nr:hypothetical protein [Streptomyces sp. NBC_00154]
MEQTALPLLQREAVLAENLPEPLLLGVDRLAVSSRTGAYASLTSRTSSAYRRCTSCHASSARRRSPCIHHRAYAARSQMVSISALTRSTAAA